MSLTFGVTFFWRLGLHGCFRDLNRNAPFFIYELHQNRQPEWPGSFEVL